MKDRKTRKLIMYGLMVALLVTTVAYAALQTTLNINGTVTKKGGSWNIYFTNLSTPSKASGTLTGEASVSNPSLSATSFTFEATLVKPLDSITYTFDVVNEGTIDAVLDSVTFTGEAEAKAKDITYTLTYADGTAIAKGDALASEQTKSLKLTLSYDNVETLDSEDSTLDVGATLVYVQASNTVEDDGSSDLLGKTGPNAPNLLNSSLTPVVWDGENWRVADTSTEWYDYDNQQWANAVILNSGVTKNVNDVVVVPTETSTTSEVKAMYVWIPRYEYKIEGQYGTHTDGTAGTAATPGEIMVNFVPQMQTTASTGYILHPAFWWDDNSNGTREAGEELSGIWVGKFQTSGTETAPTVLPNVETKILTFTSSLLIKNYLATNTNTDSHMMKNSEYGAVAYLTQSKYGKYGNASYVGAAKEVDVTPYIDFQQTITGRSNGSPKHSISIVPTLETTYEYSEENGFGASSTGTIYGIYDLNSYNGTSVMAYYDWDPTKWPNSTVAPDNTFAEKPASKYFDNYTSGDFATACGGVPCLGHALTETAGWYGDSIGILNTDEPWVNRGRIGLFNSNRYATHNFISSHHSVLISIGG